MSLSLTIAINDNCRERETNDITEDTAFGKKVRADRLKPR
jgi:hypothetical protein